MSKAIATSIAPLLEVVEKPERPELLLLLLSISKSARALVGIKLAALGLYSGQDELLLELHDSQAIPVAVLADRLSVRPSTVSKMLDRLGELGMTKREPDKQDARRVLVRITPTGMEVRDRVLKVRQAFEDELHSGLAADSDRTALALNSVSMLLRARLRRRR